MAVTLKANGTLVYSDSTIKPKAFFNSGESGSTTTGTCAVTYTNSTGRPINVLILSNPYSYGTDVRVNGVTTISTGSIVDTHFIHSIIVPVGGTWSLQANWNTSTFTYGIIS